MAEAEGNRARHTLVVDDDPMVRTFLQQALDELGHAVIAAENGMQALDIFRDMRTAIGLLVTDISMPVMDGVTLIRQVRQLDGELPIAVVTGYADDAMLQAVEKHVAALLRKPVRFSELASLSKLIRER